MSKPVIRFVAGVLFVLPVAFASACSSSSSTGKAMDAGGSMQMGADLPFCTLGTACKAIAKACMPKDTGAAGTVHNCHLTGMGSGVESMCEQQLDGCVSACNAAPGFGDAAAAGFASVFACDGGS
ncbi:MAG TPA: hypothetical protein VH142_22740 [Polyangiaceae bacterium]|jgi:hypothetical protein|nr:hypothetical protein [Polyangiaceae bacterium]